MRGGRAPAALALLLAALLTVALAACGGDDTEAKNAYVDEVNTAQTSFASTFEQLSTRITSTSTPEEDRATLRRFRAAIDRTTARLEGVTPPDSVKELHQQFIAEIDSYGDAIRTFQGALDGDAEELAKAQAALAKQTSQTGEDINRTIERINQRLRE